MTNNHEITDEMPVTQIKFATSFRTKWIKHDTSICFSYAKAKRRKLSVLVITAGR
jgi:hypothetical protein